MKKNQTKTLIITFVIILAIGYLYSENFLTTIPYEKLIKPNWGYVSCEQSETLTAEGDVTIPKGGGTIRCGAKENVNTCDIFVSDLQQGEGWPFSATGLYLQYRICDLSGSNCGSWSSTIKVSDKVYSKISTIPEDSSMEIECKSTAGVGPIWGLMLQNECDVRKEYYPFSLFNYVNGKKDYLVTESCFISDTQSILSMIPANSQYVNEIPKGKFENYLEDWTIGYTQTYNYNGKDTYCTATGLYEIEKVQMLDGRLISIDPGTANQEAEPDFINKAGTKIKNVQCCPNIPGCCYGVFGKEDFTLNCADQVKECDYDLECSNSGDPITLGPQSYYVEQCINNKCEPTEPIHTECTSDAACKVGEVCDLTLVNYGQCINKVTQTTEWCGDGTCNGDETNIQGTGGYCPVDCGEGANGDLNLLTLLSYALIGGIVIVFVMLLKKKGVF